MTMLQGFGVVDGPRNRITAGGGSVTVNSDGSISIAPASGQGATVTSNAAAALAVGRLGATTPAFQVDASAASSITGIKVTAAASGGGVTIASIGEANVKMAINPAGTIQNASAITMNLGISAGQNETGVGLDLEVTATSLFNGASGHSLRPFYIKSTLTGTNGVGTHAGAYVEVYASHTAGTIGHVHAGAMRLYITSTGTMTNGWGLRGDITVSGAATITTLAALGAVAPTLSNNPTITTYVGVDVDAISMTGSTTTDAFGVRVAAVPTGASGKNVGLFIGGTASVGSHVAGLAITAGGAVVGGTPTVGTNTLGSNGYLVVQGSAGSQALAWFYQTSTARGFIGVLNSTTNLFGAHTATATDISVNAGNNTSGLALTTAGKLYVSGTLGFGNNSSQNGQGIEFDSVTELTTIAAAATTDTVIQIPAGVILLAVSVRVTTVIPTAATFTVTGTTSGTTFNTAAVSTAAGSTDAGTAAGAYNNTAAQTIRITPNVQPAAATGVVRITAFYVKSTPPTQ